MFFFKYLDSIIAHVVVDDEPTRLIYPLQGIMKLGFKANNVSGKWHLFKNSADGYSVCSNK